MTGRAKITHKEIQRAFRTGEPPIKLTLRYHLENALSSSGNTPEFIEELKKRKITPKFNWSKSTGRVTGISFKYRDVIYKGSTLGRKYSWNNIIKQIDYEQDGHRAIIIETNSTKRRDERDFAKDQRESGDTSKKPGTPKCKSKKSGESIGLHLGQDKLKKLNYSQIDDGPLNAFKLELDADGRFMKKKRKGKGPIL